MLYIPYKKINDVTGARAEAEEFPIVSVHVHFLSKCVILEQTRVRNSTKISLTGINVTIELAESSFVVFLSVLYSLSHCDVFAVPFSCSFRERAHTYV